MSSLKKQTKKTIHTQCSIANGKHVLATQIKKTVERAECESQRKYVRDQIYLVFWIIEIIQFFLQIFFHFRRFGFRITLKLHSLALDGIGK